MTPWTVARQAPLSMWFPRQEYWSGLPFPPGNLPHSGMESPSPVLAGEFFTTEHQGSPLSLLTSYHSQTAQGKESQDQQYSHNKVRSSGERTLDFPDGPVVKNLLASAGNMGSIHGPGRPYMLRSNEASESQLLKSEALWSPCPTTKEVTAMRSPWTTRKSSSFLPQLEKASVQQQRYSAVKSKLKKKKKSEDPGLRLPGF